MKPDQKQILFSPICWATSFAVTILLALLLSFSISVVKTESATAGIVELPAFNDTNYYQILYNHAARMKDRAKDGTPLPKKTKDDFHLKTTEHYQNLFGLINNRKAQREGNAWIDLTVIYDAGVAVAYQVYVADKAAALADYQDELKTADFDQKTDIRELREEIAEEVIFIQEDLDISEARYVRMTDSVEKLQGRINRNKRNLSRTQKRMSQKMKGKSKKVRRKILRAKDKVRKSSWQRIRKISSNQKQALVKQNQSKTLLDAWLGKKQRMEESYAPGELEIIAGYDYDRIQAKFSYDEDIVGAGDDFAEEVGDLAYDRQDEYEYRQEDIQEMKQSEVTWAGNIRDRARDSFNAIPTKR